MDDDDDTQVYKDHGDALTIAYQSGYYDGKKAAQPAQEPWREFASDYERGVIDGRQKQMQSSVDKAVNAMTQRTRVVLTDKEIEAIWKVALFADYGVGAELSNQPFVHYARAIEAKLKEKNT